MLRDPWKEVGCTFNILLMKNIKPFWGHPQPELGIKSFGTLKKGKLLHVIFSNYFFSPGIMFLRFIMLLCEGIIHSFSLLCNFQLSEYTTIYLL